MAMESNAKIYYQLKIDIGKHLYADGLHHLKDMMLALVSKTIDGHKEKTFAAAQIKDWDFSKCWDELERTGHISCGDVGTLRKLFESINEDVCVKLIDKAADDTTVLVATEPSDTTMQPPIIYNLHPPISSFTGREHFIEDLHAKMQSGHSKMAVVSQITSVSGLGGVGNSEVARKYVATYYPKTDPQNNVIWINAEKRSTLTESFRNLAQSELNISTKNVDGQDKEVKVIVKDVYKFFSTRKICLFVFDNAEQYKTLTADDPGIDIFLPEVMPGNEPRVLITSRVQTWGEDIDVISLDVFTEDEAVKLVRNRLNIQGESHREDIIQLVHELGCFPLALQQALSYIQEEEISIKEYLTDLKQNSKDTLVFKNQEYSQDNYLETTFSTWKITVDKIRAKNELAEAILNILAYFGPDSIPEQMLLGLDKVSGNRRTLSRAIRLLRQYSMVTVMEDVVNVHRLVQQVIRIQLNEQNAEEATLKQALDLFYANLNKDNLNHAIHVWSYAEKYGTLVNDFCVFPSEVMIKLKDYGRHREAIRFGTQSLGVIIEIMGSENPASLSTMNKIVEAHTKLGAYDEAMALCREVIDNRIKVLGPQHQDTLDSMSNMAQLLMYQAKYDESLQLYQEIVPKMKVISSNSRDTLAAMNNMALVLKFQGKYEESLELYNETLQKMIQVFGPDHIYSIVAMHNIAWVHHYQEKYDVAVTLFKELVKREKEILGDNHPGTLFSTDRMAVVYDKQGRYEEALLLLTDVLEKWKIVLGADHPDTLTTMSNIAGVLEHQAKYYEALTLFEKVLQRRRQVLVPQHPDTRTTEDDIARMQNALGK